MVVVCVMLVVEGEIEYANDIDGLELVVPTTFLSLLLYGERGIVEASVLEELLFSTLHFH